MAYCLPDEGRVARECRLYRIPMRPVTAAVTGRGDGDLVLKKALKTMGCRVEREWRKGIAAFSVGDERGFHLTAQDETGAHVSADQLLTLVALIEMENGCRQVVVPQEASAAIEVVAAGYGGKVVRQNQPVDGDGALPWFESGIWGGARICARMGMFGERLERLIRKTPRFSTWEREISLSSDQGQVLDRLGEDQGLQGGMLRIHTGGSWISVAPVPKKRALQVIGEGADMELAAELCDFYAGKAAEIDRLLARQTGQDNQHPPKK